MGEVPGSDLCPVEWAMKLQPILDAGQCGVVLREMPGVEATSNGFKSMQAVGIALLVFGVAVPIIWLFYIYKHGKVFDDPSIQAKYGVFTEHFRTNFRYWESIKMINLIIILFVDSRITKESERAGTITIVMTVFTAMQMLYTPYLDHDPVGAWTGLWESVKEKEWSVASRKIWYRVINPNFITGGSLLSLSVISTISIGKCVCH